MVCRASPGYVVKNAHRIVERDEDYTQEGVVAHELGAAHLLGKPFPFDVEPDMKVHLTAYGEFVRKAKGRGDVTMLVETAVKVFYYPGKKGYVDVALIFIGKDGKVRRIHIIDLKYGRGVSVEALRNPQLSSYAFGLIKDLEDVYQFTAKTEVVITIWQPRVQGEQTERTWELSMDELAAFCKTIGDTAADIRAEPFNQKFAPSDDGCTFCPAFEFCEARTRWLLGEEFPGDVIDLSPMVLDADVEPDLALEVAQEQLPAPGSLTPQQLARILLMKPLLTKWLEKTEKYIVADALQHDTPYPGFKVVATTPHRRWKNEAEAEKFLRAHLGLDVAAPRKLITPAQALELLKAREKSVRGATLEKAQAMMIRPEGQATLTTLDDSRPEFKDVKPEDEFTDGTIDEADQSLL